MTPSPMLTSLVRPPTASGMESVYSSGQTPLRHRKVQVRGDSSPWTRSPGPLNGGLDHGKPRGARAFGAQEVYPTRHPVHRQRGSEAGAVTFRGSARV